MRGVLPSSSPGPTRWAVSSDLALAVLCGYAGALLAQEITASVPRERAVAAVVIAVVHGSCVGLRRVAPGLMLALLVVTALAYAGLGFPVALLGPAVLVAVYSVAAMQPRRRAVVTLAATQAALAVLVLGGPGNRDVDSLVLYAGLLAGAWFLGDVAHRWRRLAQENGRRAAELERARTELAAQAVALERVRIARELHDVVAHSMSVVAMHAGAGRLAVGRDPAAATSALMVIERTTRQAMAEMRRLVTVLRDEDVVGGDASPPAPAPGLGDLPQLVAGMATAGLVVEVRTEGDLAAVSPGVSLTAHRVVQEALTNVARHAGPTRAQVGVLAADGILEVTVENEPGRRTHPAADHGGHGLQGMRERVELYGGTVEARPTSSGGFSVVVRLPSAEAA